jgi:hypothetical protein
LVLPARVPDAKGGSDTVARHTSGSGSGLFVTVLTVGALGAVAFFAFQASAAEDRPLVDPPAGAAASPEASPSGEPGEEGDGGAQDPGEGAEQPPLPADSGEGRRVVYALGAQRVWLVEESDDGTGETVTDTHEVYPSSVTPEPGTYEVTYRMPEGTGSDGVPIEHSVVFHTAADGVVFGFSAALDGSVPDPDAELRTGAVRQTREDGDAMWDFATEGTVVVVVP